MHYFKLQSRNTTKSRDTFTRNNSILNYAIANDVQNSKDMTSFPLQHSHMHGRPEVFFQGGGNVDIVECTSFANSILPWFYDKTGLILIFTPKFTLGLIFGDVLFWYIKKWSCKVKIKRFLNTKKLAIFTCHQARNKGVFSICPTRKCQNICRNFQGIKKFGIPIT